MTPAACIRSPPSSSDTWVSPRRQFYFHSLSHWLGLDTHDTHLIGHDRQLAPGCVITIEPGLYIPDDERFGALRGIGVRIEDDVLVTEGGCEVLSRDVPATIDEVEQLVWSGLAGAVSAPLAAEAQAAAVGDARVR